MKKLEVIIEKHPLYPSRWAVKSKGDLWKDKDKWVWLWCGRTYPTKKTALSAFTRFVEVQKGDYEIELIN